MASRGAAPTDDVSLVVVLLDASLFLWESLSKSKNGLQQVLCFLNSIPMVNNLNHLVIIASGSNSCEFLYDSKAENNKASKLPADKQTVSGNVSEALEQFVVNDSQTPRFRASLLSASLSMALCYIQRVLRAPPPHPKPRILCLQGAPDSPPQYIPVMNSIFSAQRSQIPIDACVVGNQHSAFLQQAADITGGIYMMPTELDCLMQYFMTLFCLDLHSRQFMLLPRSSGVDFRASCFCHKRTIDQGYICSVCLSIFCKHRRECSTCGSKFQTQNQMAGAKR